GNALADVVFPGRERLRAADDLLLLSIASFVVVLGDRPSSFFVEYSITANRRQAGKCFGL
ncbi:hypothetical protein, partial [Pseudomonas aeruginosa]